MLLDLAKICCEQDDWEQGEALADEILDLDPLLSEALLVRARARRFLGSFESAIEDYDKALQSDPENAETLMYRGATIMDQSSHEADYVDTIEMIVGQAIPNFRRAAYLDPGSVSIELSLVEAELCIGHYMEAVAGAGTCWGRTDSEVKKCVCAWLGAIAMILAGRPERRWRRFADYLKDSTRQVLGYWGVFSVERFLKHIEPIHGGTAKVQAVRSIHEIFLTHYQ